VHTFGIVFFANHAVAVIEIGRRVSGAPVNEIEFGIVRTGHPWSTAAVFPALALPCLVAGLARTRNHVEAPCQSSGCDVKRREIATERAVTAVFSDDDFVFDYQRRG